MCEEPSLCLTLADGLFLALYLLIRRADQNRAVHSEGECTVLQYCRHGSVHYTVEDNVWALREVPLSNGAVESERRGRREEGAAT